MCAKQCGLLFCLILIAGCSGDPYSYIKVSGDLKFEDGELIQGESVGLLFKPQIETIGDAPPKGGHADVETEDGTFASATTHEYGDGIVEGKHKVVVVATGNDGRSVVAEEYTKEATTPLEIDTADSQTFSFRVPPRK